MRPYLWPVLSIAFSMVFALPIWLTLRYKQGQQDTPHLRSLLRSFPHKAWALLIPITACWLGIMYLPALPKPTAVFALLITFPLLCFIMTAILWKRTGETSISPFSVIGYNFGGLLFLLFSQLLTGFVLLGITDSGITYFHLELIKWNVPFDPILYAAISEIILICFMMLGVFILSTLFCYGMVLFFFSNVEAITARGLTQKIQDILE
jgi:hypothetical protein